MNRYCRICILLLTLFLAVSPCHAARVKVYVNRFAVSVTENREELRQSLQTLLSSRLNGDEIMAVDRQAEADIQVEGSYIVFGGVFSLDGLLKTSAGVFIDRVFIQGDNQGELIPAVTDMAQALRRALGKWDSSLAVKVDEKRAVATEKAPPRVKKTNVSPPAAAAAPLPVPVAKVQKNDEKPWESHRLDETLNGIAIGRTFGDKGIEVFTAGERYLRYYLKGKKLQFLSAITVGAGEKIVGVDVADLDQDGVPEVYLSVVRGGGAASQVYVPENNQLKRIAVDIPYLLRGIGFSGKEKIYAQKMTSAGALIGPVFELAKRGDRFEAENPLQLPRYGNLYNFNRFGGATGVQNLVVSHPDGYLLVYASDGRQLWKSRDKFGGSESIACGSGGEEAGAPGGCALSRPQRLLVVRGGDIIVPRNSGQNGTEGHYTKHNVLVLSWDGHSLREKWRTGLSQHYLTDFSFDESTRELLLLEVEPQADASGDRGSTVVTRRID